MKYRYPDAPLRISKEALLTMDIPGKWVAQKKLDGWRCPAYFSEGKWTYYAKDGIRLAMPPEILRREFESLAWPDDVAMDMEWMGNRQANHLKGRHSFRIFDLLYLDGRWLGEMGFLERHGNLTKVFAKASRGKPIQNLSVVPLIHGDLVAAFEKEKEDPLSEGLVVRMATSGLVGNFMSNAENPFWRKIKYRGVHEHGLRGSDSAVFPRTRVG